jgi:hypothetical protein
MKLENKIIEEYEEYHYQILMYCNISTNIILIGISIRYLIICPIINFLFYLACLAIVSGIISYILYVYSIHKKNKEIQYWLSVEILLRFFFFQICLTCQIFYDIEIFK